MIIHGVSKISITYIFKATDFEETSNTIFIAHIDATRRDWTVRRILERTAVKVRDRTDRHYRGHWGRVSRRPLHWSRTKPGLAKRTSVYPGATHTLRVCVYVCVAMPRTHAHFDTHLEVEAYTRLRWPTRVSTYLPTSNSRGIIGARARAYVRARVGGTEWWPRHGI